MKKTFLVLSILVATLCCGSICQAQEAYAALSNEGYYGFYNLLSDDLAPICKAKKTYSGTVSKLQAGPSEGTTIYSFFLTPTTGKKVTIGIILSDSEISRAKVRRFLTSGRKVKVLVRNCDGQLTAVEIVSSLPMKSEP